MYNILVTGGNSTVGKHLKKYIPEAYYLEGTAECNLLDEEAVMDMFNKIKPTTVIHLAAKVGGILDNINKPVDYFEDNLRMNMNVLRGAHKFNCARFIGILSTCIYPDELERSMYPLDEGLLHSGPPTPTNFTYGYAKRCLAVAIDAYNTQYKTRYNYLIPCNLYSEFDINNGAKAHFVTALLKKIKTAVVNNDQSIELFGTGHPLRQFMYADDLARVIEDIITRGTVHSFNVATPEVYSIKEIAKIAIETCSPYEIDIKWDTTKPDGQYRKDVSNNLHKHIDPNFEYTPLKKGLKKVYDEYTLAS